MGSSKGNIRTEEDKECTPGYLPGAKSLSLGRMGVGNGAPEKVASEFKTDTCTAGYQAATESLCLGFMDVGKETPEKVISELKQTRAPQDTSQRLNLCPWDACAWVKEHHVGGTEVFSKIVKGRTG